MHNVHEIYTMLVVCTAPMYLLYSQRALRFHDSKYTLSNHMPTYIYIHIYNLVFNFEQHGAMLNVLHYSLSYMVSVYQ